MPWWLHKRVHRRESTTFSWLRCTVCKSYILARTNEEAFSRFVGEPCYNGPLEPRLSVAGTRLPHNGARGTEHRMHPVPCSHPTSRWTSSVDLQVASTMCVHQEPRFATNVRLATLQTQKRVQKKLFIAVSSVHACPTALLSVP